MNPLVPIGSSALEDLRPEASEAHAPWYQRVFLQWATPLLTVGSQRALRTEDLLSLAPPEQPEQCQLDFDTRFGRDLRNPPSLLRTLARMHLRLLISVLLLAVLHAALGASLPLMLQRFIQYLRHPDFMLRGLSLAGALFAGSALSWLALQQCFYIGGKLGFRLRAALVMAVYRKGLRLEPQARAEYPTGRLLNLMNVDPLRVASGAEFIASTVMSLLLIVGASVVLCMIIGAAGIAGIVSLLLLVPLANRQAARLDKVTGSLSAYIDARASIFGELLQGIRVVKAHVWEQWFMRRIEDLREQELGELDAAARHGAVLNLLFQSSPTWVAIVTLSVHVLAGHTLVFADVLATLACLGILRPPLFHLPRLIVGLVEGRTSLRRLQEYLVLPDRSSLPSTAAAGAVQASNLSAQWPGANFALRDIMLTAAPGDLVAIVGASGAGKSTLLHALIGDMQIECGTYELGGRAAFVPQTAWILSRSVRDNIVMGAAWDEARYAKVLSVCCLDEDIASWPLGDQTPISERGGSISGGQRQRINLARGLYQDADVYLLDDPFSALDPRVAAHIMQEAVLGALANKTRLLVTHQLDVARQADRIVVMERGQVHEAGRPAELLAKGGAFCELIKHFEVAGTALRETGPQHEAAARTHSKPTADQAAAAEAAADQEDEEEIGGSAIRRETYRSYLQMLGSGELLLATLGLFAAREAVLLSSDLWLAYQTSHGVSGAKIVAIFALLGIVASLLTFARARIAVRLGVRAARRLHRAFLQSVLYAPMRFFSTTPSGRILNRFTKDMRIVDQDISLRMLELLDVVFSLFSAGVMLLLMGPAALLAMLPIFYIYRRIQKRFVASARSVSRMEADAYSPLYTHLSESMDGSSSIRAYHLEDMFVSRCLSLLTASQRALFSRHTIDRWLSIRLDLLGVLLTGSVAFFAVVAGGSISAVLASMAVSYSFTVTICFQRAVHAFTDLELSMTAVERIIQYSGIPSEQQGGTSQVPEHWPSEGRIYVDGLNVIYSTGAEPALRSIEMDIRAGEHLGIVGRTGSGKSTLLSAMYRMVDPSEGRILIDEVDIAQVPLQTLRSRITLLVQEPTLFGGTIRTNLDPFGQYSEGVLMDALARSHLLPTIHQLPDGLDTAISPGGSTLSAGQRQLLCLARALLRRSRILLLDEATSNVDHEADTLIQRTIAQEFADCTVIVIAHRIQTLTFAERVIVLRQGSIAGIIKRSDAGVGLDADSFA